jgi:hypothetical protein
MDHQKRKVEYLKQQIMATISDSKRVLLEADMHKKERKMF